MILKKGDKGENVKALQKALKINADGIFGNGTEIVVKKYQKEHNLTADGIVGEKTLKALGLSFNDDIKVQHSSEIDIKFMPITRHITKKPRDIKYIVLHFTAGSTSKKGSAINTRNYFQKSERGASADFCIDDVDIVQVNPDLKNYYCWAVGDGKITKRTITNTNSVSIEMCSTLKRGTSVNTANHSGWSFTKEVIDNAVKLTKYLMKTYNIDVNHVVRHFDATTKLCPGIPGWNTGEFYSEDGKRLGKKNNEDEWIKFKKRLV